MYDLEMALLRQKLREKNTDIGLPTFHLNGCRYRPRIVRTRKWRRPCTTARIMA